MHTVYTEKLSILDLGFSCCSFYAVLLWHRHRKTIAKEESPLTCVAGAQQAEQTTVMIWRSCRTDQKWVLSATETLVARARSTLIKRECSVQYLIGVCDRAVDDLRRCLHLLSKTHNSCCLLTLSARPPAQFHIQ